MKIFNWVHRKFNHNVLKDGLARNVKKTESIAIDTNTKALLEQVALVDVFDGWRDGILTIGTFGFDPLKPDNEQNGQVVTVESEDDEEEVEYDEDEDDNNSDINNNVEDEEVNPLMFTTFQHNFEFIDSNTGINSDVIMTVNGVPLTPLKGSAHDIDTIESDQAIKRKRTTLAELFYADSDISKKQIPKEFEPNPDKKASLRTKHGLSFAKKLIPHVGEDSRPIKKLHQLMRRMLKRKIHPELDGKAQKSETQTKSTILELLASKPNEAVESVSLLEIPETNA